MRRFALVIGILIAFSAGAGALALGRGSKNPSAGSRYQPANYSTRKTQYELDVPGSQQWTDSKIDLLAGDRLVITATGSIEILGSNAARKACRAGGWICCAFRRSPTRGTGR
jgi:hypothetical protein